MQTVYVLSHLEVNTGIPLLV